MVGQGGVTPGSSHLSESEPAVRQFDSPLILWAITAIILCKSKTQSGSHSSGFVFYFSSVISKGCLNKKFMLAIFQWKLVQFSRDIR